MSYKSTVTKSTILLAIILSLYSANAFAKHKNIADTKQTGSWTLSNGDWYYASDKAIRNTWIDDKYFIDESGRMVSNEWIYLKDGVIQHSKEIACDDMTHIDMTHLFYVGEDGLKIKNKTIYYTPISFDADGQCSLNIDDLGFIDNSKSGLDGLRRYIIFNGGYKEYY